MNDRITRHVVVSQLQDAVNVLQRMIAEVENGEHDDARPTGALANTYEFVIGCLALSWHMKWWKDERVAELTDAEYDLLAHCMPNWGHQLRLVGPEWSLEQQER